MKRTSPLLLSALTLTPALAAAQNDPPPPQTAPAPTGEMVAPDEGVPGLRVAPQQSSPSAAQGQPPPPPAPGAAPWGTQQPPPGAQPQPPPGYVYAQPQMQPPPGYVYAQPQMQPPPGYVYAQPQMYGQPLVYGQTLRAAALIPYDGGPVPQGMRVITRPRTGLIVGGAVMFGSAWLTSLIVASAARDSSEGFGWLALPVVGPLVAGGVMRGTSTTGWTVLILDTLLQSGGLAMFIHGLTHPAQYIVQTPQARGAGPRLRWAVAPGSSAGPGATFSLNF